MVKEKEFKLSDFFNESLSLDLENISQTRAIYSKKVNDKIEKISKMNPYDVLGEKKFEERKKVPEDTVGTPIQEFYRGAHIFITGGTGFVGKILTEKLIRSVPHLEQIYLLIRAKRGKSVRQRFDQLLEDPVSSDLLPAVTRYMKIIGKILSEKLVRLVPHLGQIYLLIRATRGKSARQRFETLLEDPVFRRMKAEVPDYAGKLTVVEGDISSPRLGLSPEDERTLVDHVTVVFHSAADVRFVEPLKDAVASNVTGSRNMLVLAHRMDKLKVYVHVSTAYSQCVRRVVEETVPRMSLHYQEVLNMIDSLTDQEIEDDLPRILQGWPNTYTFTKAICEELVVEEGKGLPICIFRPAAVVNTYYEPVRGWTDNLYGPIGLSIAVSMGVLHCLRLNQDQILDMVPVDLTVNCALAVAWHRLTHRANEDFEVYNFVSTPSSTTPWKINIKNGNAFKHVFPFQLSIWSYSLIAQNILIVDEVLHVLLHKIPGMVLDKLVGLFGGKARLTKIYDRIHGLKTHIRFFTTRMWEFKSGNVQSMLSLMTPEDKTLFNFDIRGVDNLELFLVSKLGMRYYFFKEEMTSLPQAQRKNTVFWWLHNTGKCLFGLAVLKILVMVAHALPF